VLSFIVLACGSIRVEALAADAPAAQSLAQKSGCFKCHGVDKKKDGPALRDAAAKYKDKTDGQEKLIYHVTSGEKVKFEDGHEEEHKKVKTKRSERNQEPGRLDSCLAGRHQVLTWPVRAPVRRTNSYNG